MRPLRLLSSQSHHGIPRRPNQSSVRTSVTRSRSQSATSVKSSLDITQRIEKKLAEYNASQSIFRRWMFEILSVTSSAVCMGIIIVVLAIVRNQPLAKWSFALTIVTVLSKVASAALILPISEAIGQLKWNWFQGKESKEALDFEIFDKASRGPWGSILLLYRTRGKSLAALGAILTLLLLGIDTFFQQVTALPERWVTQGQGFTPRTIQYDFLDESQYQSNVGESEPWASSKEDMRKGLGPYFYDQNGTHFASVHNSSQMDIPFSCPTSRCEWEPFDTLGVCSACTPVSDMLEYACRPMKLDWLRNSPGPGTESTWPNGTACGYFLNATSSSPMLMSGYLVNRNMSSEIGETLLMRILPLVSNPDKFTFYDGSLNYKHINYPLMDAIVVSAADGTPESVYRKELPVAHECMLSWCVKTVQASYAWGSYQERVLKTYMNTTSMPFPWITQRFEEIDGTDVIYVRNISILPSPTSPEFTVSNTTMVVTLEALNDIFPSSITVANATAKPFLKIRTSFQKFTVFRPVHFNPFVAPNNVPNHFEMMATAITNVVRSDFAQNTLVSGRASTIETFVAVHWEWLTFPLMMLVLSTTFLIATIVKTSKASQQGVGVWKTSAMPTLMYSLPPGASRDLTPSTTWTSKASTQKSTRIRLLPNQGWRLSGQQSSTLPMHISQPHT